MDKFTTLYSRVHRVWREGHISRNERDVCFAVINWAKTAGGDYDTLTLVLERLTLYPVFFGDCSLGGKK